MNDPYDHETGADGSKLERVVATVAVSLVTAALLAGGGVVFSNRSNLDTLLERCASAAESRGRLQQQIDELKLDGDKERLRQRIEQVEQRTSAIEARPT